MATVIGRVARAERRKGRLGRIFKHDVAITSDQSGIFHPAPFIRRKRERREVVQPRGPHPRFYPLRSPSPSPPPPALVRIINGQFAASAADCIVSLFSGPPSVGWQVPSFLFLASFSPSPPPRPIYRPYSGCLAASLTPSGFPSRSPSDRDPNALSFLRSLFLIPPPSF